ncbi:long-chain fatty acid--CoA ligase [Mumia zhuanghuii]|uniref:Long-chain fatty acid--CoA ligase n=2 Tax=Mumia TaxID=1546255 RepID=A0A5Q6S235_9ACTN|nr:MULTISPECIES: long-chain fatty acid--CoA ligase [Mumia]KAA1418049.1 long-chain fatty acid--CoA ligase [Mumia zhuanghuii]KAA1424396.1 long-chain fatty acid--CoA ligase [Mumia zhuanghuii]
MRSTMQDVPLSLGRLMQYGTTAYADASVVTATADGTRTRSYGEVGRRVARLANALRDLGITGDERVGTFMWNNAEHLEAYLAIPSMGAVLHTINIRLFPEQVVYVVNHAEDRVVIVDASLAEPFAAMLPEMTTVTHVLVARPDTEQADLSSLEATGRTILRYEDVLEAASEDFAWPEVDERDAAAMCYTSGTTGNPKGVVYSHRSAYLHSMSMAMGDNAGMGPDDRVLPVVPMFHANAWGLPYAAVLVGASLVMPDRWLQAEPLVRLIQETRPTLAGGVPTIFNDVLGWIDEHPSDLRSLRAVLCGGSAVPESLQRALWDRHGVRIQQAWGMTETSPVATSGKPPVGLSDEEAWPYRAGQGRLLGGVEGRLVGGDGEILPHDGEAVGEVEVRGPWITGAYYLDDDPEKFRDGWLRTGDVGTIDRQGFITLTDRAKDVIKSGGEWISSVELENALMGHPDVVEAAVVGIPDEKWQERPLATVVVRSGATVTPEELRDHLAGSFAKWQLPDAWTFIDAVPRTSVGKFDKKVLRRRYADGGLDVQHG